ADPLVARLRLQLGAALVALVEERDLVVRDGAIRYVRAEAEDLRTEHGTRLFDSVGPTAPRSVSKPRGWEAGARPLVLVLFVGRLEGGHDLLGQRARELVVVAELHREGAAAAREGAEVGRVLKHLGHGDQRLDDLVAALRVHAQ